MLGWHTSSPGNVYLTVSQASTVFHVLRSGRGIFYKAKLSAQFCTESSFAAHLSDFLSLHLDEYIINKYFALQPGAQVLFLVHTAYKENRMD